MQSEQEKPLSHSPGDRRGERDAWCSPRSSTTSQPAGRSPIAASGSLALWCLALRHACAPAPQFTLDFPGSKIVSLALQTPPRSKQPRNGKGAGSVSSPFAYKISSSKPFVVLCSEQQPSPTEKREGNGRAFWRRKWGDLWNNYIKTTPSSVSVAVIYYRYTENWLIGP